MENKTYSEKLKDPRWQKKRLEILERDGWKCRECGDKTTTLNIHHIFYIPKTEPWDIPDGLLITLCESCHKPETCYPDQYKSCEECPEYNKDCFGCVDIPKELINEISLLLGFLWEKDSKRGVIDLVHFAKYLLEGIN